MSKVDKKSLKIKLYDTDTDEDTATEETAENGKKRTNSVQNDSDGRVSRQDYVTKQSRYDDDEDERKNSTKSSVVK